MKKDIVLDEYEKKIMESLDKGEWTAVKDIEKAKENLKEIAKNTLKTMKEKRKAISIKIPMEDLNKIQIKAKEEGLPYQTLINSILHKYVANL